MPLRSVNDIRGYVLNAQDGEIGKCSDFLFDDKDWVVRYIVADTMKWLPGRKVLISPISIGEADGTTRRLSVALTKDLIKGAPPLDADAPVSRQYEIAFNRYHDWAHYWGGTAVWGPHPYPRLLNRPETDRAVPPVREETSRLRSTKEVTGYRIQATDRDIGHVDDFIADPETWRIRYLAIDTRNWLPASKKVLTAPSWVELVDWKRRKVLVDLTADAIENSPAYNPRLPVNRDYEVRLYDFYGRPYDW
jgi:hypothetical protein